MTLIIIILITACGATYQPEPPKEEVKVCRDYSEDHWDELEDLLDGEIYEDIKLQMIDNDCNKNFD